MKHLFATDYNLQFNIWIFSVSFKCVFALVTEDFLYIPAVTQVTVYIFLCVMQAFIPPILFFFFFFKSANICF